VVAGPRAQRHRGLNDAKERGAPASRRAKVLTAAAAAAAVVAAMTGCVAVATANAQTGVGQCPDPTMLIQQRAPGAVTLICTGDGFPTRSANTDCRARGGVPPSGIRA
jgi:hypothetical protein